MPKRTSAADGARAGAFPLRFVIVTLDAHLADAVAGARTDLARDLPGLELIVHVAADWADDAAAAERCRADLRRADIIAVTQLFLEDQVAAVLPTLTEQRDRVDALFCAVSAPELVRLTRLGRFSMGGDDAPGPWSPLGLLKKLRGNRADGKSSGERQMQTLRMLPKLLRFVPGTAQDVRAYFLGMQCWLSGSAENLATMIRLLVGRYAAGPRKALRDTVVVGEPVQYPDVGVYHPDLATPLHLSADPAVLPARGREGRVGILLFRSYVLAGNTAHYDGVIRALEARGLTTIPVFTATLDGRPAIDTVLAGAGVDAVVSLTGFSLVGGPAYTDAAGARAILETLDVPYLAAQTLEFQSVADWQADPRGLNALQATLQVALPELDGATGPIVFAGKSTDAAGASLPIPERVDMLASRVAKLVSLRRTPRADRKVAIVIFNFPPNAGNTGSAAYLSVFESLQRTLAAMAEHGYTVDLPSGVDDLRTRITEGNRERYGAPANVHTTIAADVHVRREPHLAEIERTWGPAPGRQLTDGRSIFVLGAQFGNVFIGVQPAFGWEGDPMRLLFEGNFSPTHAFSAFYRWVREDFGADVALHFGTHGALEFLPGKQVGLSGTCWPERLIRDLPNVYLYASNNSSEGTLAKRRGGATLVSYLTPPIANAGLYKGLADLKVTLERYRGLAPDASDAERRGLVELAWSQAATLELEARDLEALRERLRELEESLIPVGLHVVGVPPTETEAAEMVAAIERCAPEGFDRATFERALRRDHELPGLLRALDGRYVPPAPGGDILRTPAVVPTGRNIYGFDPYRVPSAYALRAARGQVDQILARSAAGDARGALPETVALVLWGTDNMKTEGEGVAQALTLLGAVPRFDGVGRLCGARLLPLAQLGRARIDVVMTLSGVFRDLFPLQVTLLAEAAWLAAQADEPLESNHVRRHALAYQAQFGCDLATAALRVFSNAEGAYGSNVNLVVDTGAWKDENELADVFVKRKSFAYGVNGKAQARPELMRRALADATVTFQNLDSVELGATDIDQYVESLGGLSRAVRRERGAPAAVFMGDFTGGAAKVRTLAEQVELETRTRTLNPKWYEAQLRFGFEGVRNIASRAGTTLGWSATAGAESVPQWVYREMAETFVLDAEMRDRLAALNPSAAAGMAGRLLEATDRGYWAPDAETLERLRDAAAELEDRLEGVDTHSA